VAGPLAVVSLQAADKPLRKAGVTSREQDRGLVGWIGQGFKGQDENSEENMSTKVEY